MARRSESEDRIPERRRRSRRRTKAPSSDELVATGAGERSPHSLAGDATILPDGSAFFVADVETNRSGVDGNRRLTPELAALLEEERTAAAAGEAQPSASPAAQGPQLDREQFTRIMGRGIGAASRGVCAWLKLSPLDDDEVGDLAGALYELAAAYDVLGQVDPKTAALFNAGLVISGITMNRKRLAPPAPATSAELERQVHQDPAAAAAAASATPPRPSPATLSSDLNAGFAK